MTTDLTVNRHATLSRYEGRVGTELVTVVDFVQQGDQVRITHTGTEPAWRGQGLAGRTTERVLTDLRDRGVRVVPACPFTVAFMKGHPEFDDLRLPPAT